MPIVTAHDIVFQTGQGVILALDVGLRKIGLSFSDEQQTFAFPFRTFKRTKWIKDRQWLKNLMEDRKVAVCVLGWPVHMTGHEGQRCQSVRDFTLNLMQIYDLPCCLWDERYTTRQAKNFQKSMQVQHDDDTLAATFILQSFLSFLKHQRTNLQSPNMSNASHNCPT